MELADGEIGGPGAVEERVKARLQHVRKVRVLLAEGELQEVTSCLNHDHQTTANHKDSRRKCNVHRYLCWELGNYITFTNETHRLVHIGTIHLRENPN